MEIYDIFKKLDVPLSALAITANNADIRKTHVPICCRVLYGDRVKCMDINCKISGNCGFRKRETELEDEIEWD